MGAWDSDLIQMSLNPLDYDIESFSDQQTNWPAENVKDFVRQTNVWRTVDLDNAAELIGDLGTQKLLNFFTLINVNYPTCVVQFDDDPLFATPLASTGVLILKKNRMNNKYSIHFNPQDYDAEPVNFRYFRVVVDKELTTTDGLPYYCTGAIACDDSMEDFPSLPNSGFALSGATPVSTLQMMGGRDEDWELGNDNLITLGFTANAARDEAEFDKLMDLFYGLPVGREFVIGLNNVLHEQSGGNWVLPVKKREVPEYGLESYGKAGASGVLMKETK